MVGPILDDHAADGSPYARRCLILGLILAWLISPACVTFRCEVLSEGKTVAHRRYYASLNTPFGAWCFPTQGEATNINQIAQSQCTFWCLVLSDDRFCRFVPVACQSQCTFWCLMLSDSS